MICIGLFPIYTLSFIEIAEMLPGILNQLGAESLNSLKKLANSVTGGKLEHFMFEIFKINVVHCLFIICDTCKIFYYCVFK